MNRSARIVLTATLVVGLVGCVDDTTQVRPAVDPSPTSPTATVDPSPTSRAATVVPHPNEKTTGARGDLRLVRGGITIDQPNTVLQAVDVRGQVTVKAEGVVIRNVRIRSDSFYALLVTGGDALIEDVTLEGHPDSSAALAATEGGRFVARRLDVSGAEDGVRLADDCTLADSYVHDLRPGPGHHNDAVTADGYSNWKITGNTILNQHDSTAAVWVGDARFGPSSGVLSGNLLAGGGYTVYAGPGSGAGIRVKDNVFSTRFHPQSGAWGPVYDWIPDGNVWTGNVWADGPQRGRPVAP